MMTRLSCIIGARAPPRRRGRVVGRTGAVCAGRPRRPGSSPLETVDWIGAGESGRFTSNSE